MSLSHSKYLQTLPSERREVATIPTLQQQIDKLKQDMSLLLGVVDKLVVPKPSKDHPYL